MVYFPCFGPGLRSDFCSVFLHVFLLAFRSGPHEQSPHHMTTAKHAAGDLGEKDVRVDAVRESFTQGRFIGGPREHGDLICIGLGSMVRLEMGMGGFGCRCCWWWWWWRSWWSWWCGRCNRALFSSSAG